MKLFRYLLQRLLVMAIIASSLSNVRASDPLGQDDPLVAALVRHDYSSAKDLLAGGYPVSGRSSLTQAPAFWAIVQNDTRGLRLLIDAGLDVNHEWGMDGGNLLTNAVQLGSLEEVRLLCQAGASVQRDAWFGRSPLGASVIYGHPEVEQYLRTHGARYNSWDIETFGMVKTKPK